MGILWSYWIKLQVFWKRTLGAPPVLYASRNLILLPMPGSTTCTDKHRMPLRCRMLRYVGTAGYFHRDTGLFTSLAYNRFAVLLEENSKYIVDTGI